MSTNKIQAPKPATVAEVKGSSPAEERSADSGEIRRLAYHLWEERGRPWNSPEEDWNRAEQELSSRDAGEHMEAEELGMFKVVGASNG